MINPINTPQSIHQKSIATVSLSGTLPEKLEAAAAVGFDGVEIFENDLLTFDGSPAEVRSHLRRSRPDDHRSSSRSAISRRCRSRSAPATSTAPNASSTSCRRSAPTLCWCAATSSRRRSMTMRAPRPTWPRWRSVPRRRGLRVGYEALAWGRHVNRWRHAWDIVRQADHPALGLILDSFHTLALGDDHSGIADVPAEKIFFVQLADAPRLSMDVLSWSRHFRNFPGQGELAGRPVPARGPRRRLSRAAVAGDFQRRIPRRTRAADRARRAALPDLLEAEAGGTGPAAGARRSTASSSWNSPSTKRPRDGSGSSAQLGLHQPAGIARSRSSCTARAASTSC